MSPKGVVRISDDFKEAQGTFLLRQQVQRREMSERDFLKTDSFKQGFRETGAKLQNLQFSPVNERAVPRCTAL